jgi:hypothetical protein
VATETENEVSQPPLFSTYLGADGPSFGDGIATDIAGIVDVTGLPFSTNFPNTNTTTRQAANFVVQARILVPASTPITPDKLIHSYEFYRHPTVAFLSGACNLAHVNLLIADHENTL